MKQVCVYPGQIQRAPGFLPRGRMGSPTQSVLFQTRNFSSVSQEPEGPGPEVSCSECLPSFHEAVYRWGSLLKTHLGQRGGAGEEQTCIFHWFSETLPLHRQDPHLPLCLSVGKDKILMRRLGPSITGRSNVQSLYSWSCWEASVCLGIVQVQ